MSVVIPHFPARPRPLRDIRHSFPAMRLPAEIRFMIWEYSLPEARVYEIMDRPNAKSRTPAQDGLMFANIRHEPPPPLAAVCRETRFFVLRRYKPLTLSTTTKYVDLSRDILLLEPYLLVKRLLRTIHFLSQIPLVRDTIGRLALGTSYGLHIGLCHPILSWKVSKASMTTLLARLAKFPKLKNLIFVVHQEFQFDFDFRLAYDDQHPLYLHPNTVQNPASASGCQARPQLVHQGYRFKFDIESHINHRQQRHHHSNEFLYYPLDIDEDEDDGCDLLGDEGEWCDPWPTNDDWRRFRRRFQRAINTTTTTIADKSAQSFGECSARDGSPSPLALEGASLLWRYTTPP